MEALKTFREIRTETPDSQLYPNDVPQQLKIVINTWFDDRRVADNDKFARWFRRVMVRDYGLYHQLLRVEPGVSNYDWLVQKYEESQTYDITEKTSSGTRAINGTASQGGTITDAGEFSETDGKTITHDESNGSTLTGTRDEANGKTSTVTRDEDNVSRETLDRTEGETIGRTDQASGTDVTTSSSGKQGQQYRQHSRSEGVHTDVFGESSEAIDTKNMSKATPMSEYYAAQSGMPAALDWSNPSGQTEETMDEEAANHTETATNTTAGGDETTTNRENINGSKSTQHGLTHDIDETRDKDTDETREKSDTKDIDISQTDEETKDIDTSETRTETKDIDISETGEKSGTKGNTRTLDTESASSTEETNDSSEGGEALRQHLHTGRDVDVATLLRNATEFIEKSSAWAWLQLQLEPCFMGIYDD